MNTQLLRHATLLVKTGGQTFLVDPMFDAAGSTDPITQYNPDLIVVNAGAAQFLQGDPITMTAGDVIQVANAAPKAAVIPVHMEAINHCLLTRSALRSAVDSAGIANRVLIPTDGETISF